VCLLGLGLALVLCLYRLVRGPTLPDRVAALDGMAVAAVFSVLQGDAVWIDVGIGAVVSFLGTTAIAQYLVKRGGSAWC
jgi:multicomponent Na+:H+ antiporter subunit F